MRPYLPLYGAGFLFGGLALVVGARPGPSRWLELVGRVVTAVTFLAVLFASSLPNRTWTGVLFYAGFGTLLLVGPWLGPWARARVDPHSLPTRFGLALGAAVAIPIIVLVGLSAEREESAARAATLVRQQDEATLVARAVADYVSLHQAGLQAVAAVPDLLGESSAAQTALLVQVNAAYPDVFAMQLADATGQPLARSDGRSLESVADRATFADARRTLAPVVAELPSTTTGRPVLHARRAGPGSRLRFVGFVSADIAPERLAAMLAGEFSADDDRDQQIFLVDGSGRSGSSRRDSGHQRRLRLPGSSRRSAAAAAAPSSSADPTGRSSPPTAPIPRLAWGIVDQRSEASVLGPAWARRDAAFLLLLPLVLVAAAVGALAARWLSSPLLALTVPSPTSARAPPPRRCRPPVFATVTSSGRRCARATSASSWRSPLASSGSGSSTSQPGT